MEEIELRMCYTCLNFSQQLIDLEFCDVDDKITYYTKLSCLVASDLVKQEVMAICDECIRDLRIAYKFQETVANSQSTFRKYLEECKTEAAENATSTYQTSDGNIYIEISDGKTQSRLLDFSTSADAYLYSPTDVKEESEDLVCKTCSQAFASNHDLENHQCYKVIKVETSDEELKPLKQTKKKRNSDVSYQCGVCDAIFDKRWQLRKHILRLHVVHKEHVCKYCGRGFKQPYHLKEHLTTHTGEKHFTCDICDKKFQRLSSVKRHMKSHTAPPGQKTKRTPFLCNVCGKSFPFSNGVQRHLSVHFGIRKHECKICNKKFTQSTHLHVHMRTHTGERPYICDICGETFSLKATLQKHISNVHQNESSDVILVCSVCSDIFSDDEALQTHISEAHTFDENVCQNIDENNVCQNIDEEIGDKLFF